MAVAKQAKATPVSRQIDMLRPDGTVAGRAVLAGSLFGVQPHLSVLHQVVKAQLAARRSGTQSTKTRAEVRGGGAKPFKQKGTGRARQGSLRAPQFAGGGIALGPKPRSYKERTPKKMVRLALASALSDRAAQDRIVVVDDWALEVPSTKAGLAALSALGVGGRVLVVVDATDEVVSKSLRNLPWVHILVAGELNAYDVLCSDWVVFTSDTLPVANLDEIADAGADRAPEAVRTADAEGGAELGEVEEDAVMQASSGGPATATTGGPLPGHEAGGPGAAGTGSAEQAQGDPGAEPSADEDEERGTEA